MYLSSLTMSPGILSPSSGVQRSSSCGLRYLTRSRSPISFRSHDSKTSYTEGSSRFLSKGSGTLGHIFTIFCGSVHGFSRIHIFCILYLFGLWPFRSSVSRPSTVSRAFTWSIRVLQHDAYAQPHQLASLRVILAQVCATSYTKMYNNRSYTSIHAGNRNLRVKSQIPMSVKPLAMESLYWHWPQSQQIN